MPLYEYKCEKCGNVFETIQKYSDAPLTTHAGCGGKVEKLLSASAFSLKGSGWYATDYAKSGAKPEAKADGKSDGKSDTKTESKSEGSESKSESKPPPATKSD